MTAATALRNEIGTPYNPYKKDRIIGIIPDWLMERPEITPGGKLCYSKLRQHAGKDGRCWPRTDTLARETGVSERSVIRHTQELEKFNLVRTIRRGQGMSNEYIFLTHIWMYQDQEPQEPAEPRVDQVEADHQEPAEAPEPDLIETPEPEVSQIEPETDPAEQIRQEPQEAPEPKQAEVNHQEPAEPEPDQQQQNQKCHSVISRSDTLSPLSFKRLREKKTTAESVAVVLSDDQIKPIIELIPDDVNVTEGIRRIIRKNIIKHGPDYVTRNVQYTNKNIRNKGKYRAYLDKCLRGDWGIDFTEPKKSPAESVPTESEIIRELAEAEQKAEEQRTEREKLTEAFLDLPETEQERIRSEFLSNANAFTRKRTERMSISQLARNMSFQGFLEGMINPECR